MSDSHNTEIYTEKSAFGTNNAVTNSEIKVDITMLSLYSNKGTRRTILEQA